MRIGISAGFRHNSDDGKFIPASTVVESDGPMKGKVAPIVGYSVCWDGRKFFYSYIKYEAPWVWPEGSKNFAKSHGAEISTCRVAMFDCPDCHERGPAIWRGAKRDVSCPCCGSKSVSAEPIKDGSPEYFGMMRDMRADLEALAKAAFDDKNAEPFSFPVVVAGGTNVEPDKSLSPEYLGAAQAHGRGIKALANMAIDELRHIQDGDISILPDFTSGFGDYDQVREGIQWEQGAVRFYLRPWLPEPARGPTSFSAFRY